MNNAVNDDYSKKISILLKSTHVSDSLFRFYKTHHFNTIFYNELVNNDCYYAAIIQYRYAQYSKYLKQVNSSALGTDGLKRKIIENIKEITNSYKFYYKFSTLKKGHVPESKKIYNSYNDHIKNIAKLFIAYMLVKDIENIALDNKDLKNQQIEMQEIIDNCSPVSVSANDNGYNFYDFSQILKITNYKSGKSHNDIELSNRFATFTYNLIIDDFPINLRTHTLLLIVSGIIKYFGSRKAMDILNGFQYKPISVTNDESSDVVKCLNDLLKSRDFRAADMVYDIFQGIPQKYLITLSPEQIVSSVVDAWREENNNGNIGKYGIDTKLVRGLLLAQKIQFALYGENVASIKKWADIIEEYCAKCNIALSESVINFLNMDCMCLDISLDPSNTKAYINNTQIFDCVPIMFNMRCYIIRRAFDALLRDNVTDIELFLNKLGSNNCYEFVEDNQAIPTDQYYPEALIKNLYKYLISDSPSIDKASCRLFDIYMNSPIRGSMYMRIFFRAMLEETPGHTMRTETEFRKKLQSFKMLGTAELGNNDRLNIIPYSFIAENNSTHKSIRLSYKDNPEIITAVEMELCNKTFLYNNIYVPFYIYFVEPIPETAPSDLLKYGGVPHASVDDREEPYYYDRKHKCKVPLSIATKYHSYNDYIESTYPSEQH